MNFVLAIIGFISARPISRRDTPKVEILNENGPASEVEGEEIGQRYFAGYGSGGALGGAEHILFGSPGSEYAYPGYGFPGYGGYGGYGYPGYNPNPVNVNVVTNQNQASANQNNNVPGGFGWRGF